MSAPSESKGAYKSTLFDRHGPEAANLLKVAAWGGATFVLSLVLFSAAALKMAWLSPLAMGVWILACSLLVSAALAAALARLATTNAAGSLCTQFTMGGSTTPYKEQYSYQQSLVMRGELDEALQSFEAVIAERPDAIDPRIKAAELYARNKGNHPRAAELFREVQRIASVTPAEYAYATHRLVDLLTGPLADPGRALVELRRLIDRYPGSRAAAHASGALAALKPRVHGDT